MWQLFLTIAKWWMIIVEKYFSLGQFIGTMLDDFGPRFFELLLG